jgi:hypothetical protein
MEDLKDNEVASEEFFKEIERLTEMNTWKLSKIDILLSHELFDTLDEVLEALIKRLEILKSGVSEQNDLG